MLCVVSACLNEVKVRLNSFSVRFNSLREFTCTRKQSRFSTSIMLTSNLSVARFILVTLNALSSLIC